MSVVGCGKCLELSFCVDPHGELALAENQPRILIADDHRLVAEAVKNLLVLEFNGLGVVGDGHTLVEAALEMKPDVVLIDIAMPLLNGLDAGRRIKGPLPGTKIIYLTANNDSDVMAEAFAIGASGFVLKTSAFSALIQTIREAVSDPGHVIPRATLQLLDTKVGQAITTLTPRQRDVLQLLAEGLSMKEIGDALSLATRTVAFHKYRIMETPDLHSNAELVQLPFGSTSFSWIRRSRATPGRLEESFLPNSFFESDRELANGMQKLRLPHPG